MPTAVEAALGDLTITYETGRVAGQAGGAVTVRSGDTVVLVTATASGEPREGVDFFPLTCDFEERMYAVGRIPGGRIKREGRPSEMAVLTSRLMDRPIRPRFPAGLRNEVQVIAIPLSVDQDHPPDVLAVTGASAALAVSDIPFPNLIAAVRVGRVEGQFVINPSWVQAEEGDLNLVVAGTKSSIVMVEAGAREVTEEDMLAAMAFGHEHIKTLVAAQEELAAKAGKPKREFPLFVLDEALVNAVRDREAERIRTAIQQPDKAAREAGLQILRDEIVVALAPEFPGREGELGEAVDKVIKEQIRSLILDEGKRPDGRSPEDVRPITGEVGLLPRAHGSGLFTRGQTQVLSITTLGSPGEGQKLEGLDLAQEQKRFMHYYNFPPFSVGETRMLRGPGRREIGHGALAERAVLPMLPPDTTFPYSIRVISEVLESNGSSSMGSVCATTLSLMDAGVPLTKPVAGVAMGLITRGDRYLILTDIQGMEDFTGDMDFKVAGTADGITALQLDIKIEGLSMEILRDALAQAKRGRMHIMGKMLEILPAPREALSEYAPRIFILEIHPDKIGEVIGPGGKVIKKITAETGATIDIEQDGRVFITSTDAQGGEMARKMIDDITRDVRIGETYVGKVVGIQSFGAFIEILPGREGMVHISELAHRRVARVEDVVKMGDEVMVKVIDVDPQGKVKLTRKGLLEPEEGEESGPSGPPSGDGGGGGRGGRGGRGGGGGGRPPFAGGRERGREEHGPGGGGPGGGARFRPKERRG